MKVPVNVELKYVVKMESGETTEDVRTFSGLDAKQVGHLERTLLNVLLKLNKFSDDRAHGRPLPAAPSNDNPGTVFFNFTAVKEDGKLFAAQTNEWPGMGSAEIAFMQGLYEGEINRLDKDVAEKGKKGKGLGLVKEKPAAAKKGV